ncbi:hypothetical protein ACLI4Z_14395 [Natrialbaceae archaeon A-arb3/5]
MTPSADEPSPITWVRWWGIGLAAVTAVVHLVLGVDFLPHWMGIAFLSATAGFVFGIVLVVLAYRRRLVYLAGIPFTGGQLVLWYALNQPSALVDLTWIEVVDKVAQALLIVTLLVLLHRE